MTIKITTKKAKRDGYVVLRYSYFRKDRAIFSTGIVIPKSDLQASRLEKPVRSSNENAAHFNRLAAEVYHRITNIASQLYREGKEPTGSLVHRHFNKLETKLVDRKRDFKLIPAFDRFLLTKNFSSSTRKIFHLLKNDLVECFGNREMEDFRIEDWEALSQYYRGKKFAANTICIRLAKFRQFLNGLRKEGLELLITSFPKPKEEIKKLHLNDESVKRIWAYQPKDEKLKLTREMCLFQCYTGLRISDLLRLEKNHLVDLGGGRFQLVKSSYKTKVLMRIPLATELVAIFEHWGFSAPKMTEQQYNRLLKVLAKEAGIDQEIEWDGSDENGNHKPQRVNLRDEISSHACGRTAITFFTARYEPRDVCAILGKSMQIILKSYYAKATERDIIEKQLRLPANLGYGHVV